LSRRGFACRLIGRIRALTLVVFGSERLRRYIMANYYFALGPARAFDRFLDEHPSLKEALQEDPWLVNDPIFLAENPALAAFLQQEPELVDEVNENPGLFLSLEPVWDLRRAEAESAHHLW
jgi:hypothetical protein